MKRNCIGSRSWSLIVHSFPVSCRNADHSSAITLHSSKRTFLERAEFETIVSFRCAVRGRSRRLRYHSRQQGARGGGRAKWFDHQRRYHNDGHYHRGSGQLGGRFPVRRTDARDDGSQRFQSSVDAKVHESTNRNRPTPLVRRFTCCKDEIIPRV